MALRHTIRSLARAPSSTLMAIAALALGIGANTAIFSVVQAVLLHPLPYGEPDRLAALGPGFVAVSPPDFLDLERDVRSLSGAAAAEAWPANISGGDRAEQIIGLRVTPNLFEVLKVSPAAGRTFRAGEPDTVVLSFGLWQRRFGGSAEAIGETIILNGAGHTIVGVMPPGFRFAPYWITEAELWSPLDLEARAPQRQGRSIRVFARLAPGVTLEAARSEVDAFFAGLARHFPDSHTGFRPRLESLTEKSAGPVRSTLLLLMGVVGLVLLIACANVASIALARATAKRREVALRRSLGAPSWAIVRLYLAEGLVLSAAGGLGGLALAWWGTGVLRGLVRPDEGAFSSRLPVWDEIGIHPETLLFTVAIAIAAGIVSSLAPAFLMLRSDMSESLKDASRSSSGRAAPRLRRALVVGEIGVALVLLIASGLLVRSFLARISIHPGFDADRVLSFDVSVGGQERYVGPAREQIYRAILAELEQLPGVQSASMTNHLPLAGDVWGMRFAVEGRPAPRPGEEMTAVYRVSWPGYFSTMGVRLIQGREFEPRDTMKSTPVAIINETLARRAWPNADPVGMRLALGDPGDPKVKWMTVIGVAGDVKQSGWEQAPSNEIHVPFAQTESFLAGTRPGFAQMAVVVRSAKPANALAAAVRIRAASIDRNIAMSQVRTMEEVVAGALWAPRFYLRLVGLFALLALVLAATGIYGILSYEVTQRRQEIGIRMALGADRRSILGAVCRRSLGIALAGVVLGAGGALAGVRLMRGLLYGVEPTDPATIAIAATLILAFALIAALVPARRAAAVDPWVALRHD